MKKLIHLFTFLVISVVGLFAQSQEGTASYYSDKYQGSRTFSGERYNKKALTCAHKTLPMGTNLKVTNLNNDKTVTLRVNDRMSSSSKRVIDISRAGAKVIGLTSTGTAKVRLEVVTEEEKPQDLLAKAPEKAEKRPITAQQLTADEIETATTIIPKKETMEAKPEAAPMVKAVAFNAADYEPFGLLEVVLKKPEKTGFGVQLAVLNSEESLFKMLQELDEKSFGSVLVSVQKNGKDETVYKVILGQFDTEKDASKYKSRLKKNKKMDGFVVDLSKVDAQK